MNPSLSVFDVGHGSCVFVRDGNITTLLDCRDAPLFIEHLEALGIKTIDNLIVSHSDADHIGGVAAVVQSDDIKVSSIYINPDATKDSDTWQELKIALQDANNRKGLKVLAASTSCSLISNEVLIEIIAPGVAWYLTGPGGKLPNGDSVTQNGMSVVVKISHEGHPVALLCGDMEAVSLEDMNARGVNLLADILYYPHHGGYVSADGTATKKELDLDAFSVELLSKVQPKLVLFSIGRGQHATPRPIVTQRIREYSGSCAICCTQLSKRCHVDPAPKNPIHLSSLPSKGKAADCCCAGSIEIGIAGAKTLALLDLSAHSAFVDGFEAHALCRK